MMLNKELNLNECMDILNEMMKEEIEHDSGGGEIIYILIDSKKLDCLEKLIPNKEKMQEYLNDYGEDWQYNGFDITGIWGTICSKFDVDIRVNFKDKEFYINSKSSEELNVSNKEWIAELTEVDSDIWTSDVEGDSREEVIAKGMKLAKEEGLKSFMVGKTIPIGVPTIDVDSVMENASDQVYDEAGEAAEDYLYDVTKEQREELEEKLNEVFFEWIKKHKLEPSCYTVVESEVIQVI